MVLTRTVITPTVCCRRQHSAIQSDWHLCPRRANLPQSWQGQKERGRKKKPTNKNKRSSEWVLTQIPLMVIKSPQCSVMPRLCLGKLLQFSAMVTSLKIKLFIAECHLLLPGKVHPNNHTGHIIIANRSFHLQTQKCCAEVVMLSPVKGRGKEQERWVHGQENFSRQNDGQGGGRAQLS